MGGNLEKRTRTRRALTMTEEKLLAMYQPLEARLRALARSILGRDSPDVEDALQNALLKAWQKRDTVRYEMYLSGWLHRIVENECITILRQRARCRELLTDDLSKFWADISLEERVMDQMLLAFTLKCLSAPYSHVIILYYFHGLRISEIAIILQRPENTVKGLLCRARRMIQKAC